MVNSNPGFLSTLSATPNTRIVDGTDNIHKRMVVLTHSMILRLERY